MDHPSHGVTATIIDLGLARINGDDSNNGSVHWTRFDDLTFEGEGEEVSKYDVITVKWLIRR